MHLVRVRSSVTVVSNEICCSEIEFVDFYAGYVTHTCVHGSNVQVTQPKLPLPQAAHPHEPWLLNDPGKLEATQKKCHDLKWRRGVGQKRSTRDCT